MLLDVIILLFEKAVKGGTSSPAIKIYLWQTVSDKYIYFVDNFNILSFFLYPRHLNNKRKIPKLKYLNENIFHFQLNYITEITITLFRNLMMNESL